MFVLIDGQKKENKGNILEKRQKLTRHRPDMEHSILHKMFKKLIKVLFKKLPACAIGSKLKPISLGPAPVLELGAALLIIGAVFGSCDCCAGDGALGEFALRPLRGL